MSATPTRMIFVGAWALHLNSGGRAFYPKRGGRRRGRMVALMYANRIF
jgi:hypothetical protein